MALSARQFLCFSALFALATSLAVDGRAINDGCGKGCFCSKTVQLENAEGLMVVDSVGASLKGDLVNGELRWVPSGPDPLHHNGSPKKPHTP